MGRHSCSSFDAPDSGVPATICCVFMYESSKARAMKCNNVHRSESCFKALVSSMFQFEILQLAMVARESLRTLKNLRTAGVQCAQLLNRPRTFQDATKAQHWFLLEQRLPIPLHKLRLAHTLSTVSRLRVVDNLWRVGVLHLEWTSVRLGFIFQKKFKARLKAPLPSATDDPGFAAFCILRRTSLTSRRARTLRPYLPAYLR